MRLHPIFEGGCRGEGDCLCEAEGKRRTMLLKSEKDLDRYVPYAYAELVLRADAVVGFCKKKYRTRLSR